MKLLVVSQYFWPENFRINDICDGLVERGHVVDVLTSLPNVPQGRFYEGYGWFKRGPKQHNGINIERVGVVQRGRGSALRLVLNCASFAFNSLFHIPKLKKNDYDAVFVFNNSPVSQVWPAKVLAKAKQIPNIIFILDIWPESMYFLLGMKENDKKALFKKISRAVSRWFYKSGDLILISSKEFEPKLRMMGLDSEIEHFPNYAEPFEISDKSGISREKLGLAAKDFVVGFAGNVGKAQALDKLIEVAANLKTGKIKFLIVGDGSELETIKRQAAERGVWDRFVFTGWLESALVPDYLALCSALLVSLEDHEVLNLTIPAKLQTYMYASKPVVAFMNGAGAKAVREAECGVTAAAGDAGDLCEALTTISSCTKRALDTMGRNGRKYCEKNYGREQILDNLAGYIEKAVEDYKKKNTLVPGAQQAYAEPRRRNNEDVRENMKVLVVIPAYNEAESIEGVIAELTAVQPGYDYVIINDCSTDKTEEVLKRNGFNYINLPVNLGIGGGVQTGYKYAVEHGYDITVQMDGDGQHDPAYLAAVVDPVAEGVLDMCIGSRFVTKEGFQTSALRRFGINFLSVLIKLLCGIKIYDTTSGFRACSLRLAEFYSKNYAQDYPEPEAIISAVTAGYTVNETPVAMRERQGGTSSISPLKSIYYMIKVTIAVILGRVITKRGKRDE